MSTVKDALTGLIQHQPADSAREKIMRNFAFDGMVERGLTDSNAKQVISGEETAKRIRS